MGHPRWGACQVRQSSHISADIARWQKCSNAIHKSFKFRLVAVYAPNIVVERVSFFRQLAPFLDDTKRLVLMGDWNAILDPKIDKVGRGASRAGIQRALVGAVTGNRWWVSLKHRIRDFATKYGRQLNLDRTKKAKSIDDRLSRAVAGGDSLNVELARGYFEWANFGSPKNT